MLAYLVPGFVRRCQVIATSVAALVVFGVATDVHAQYGRGSTSRHYRPFSVTGGGGYYEFVRAEFASTLPSADDFVLGGGAGYGQLGLDVFLLGRYFVLETEPRGSSLFVYLEAHGMPGLGALDPDVGAGGGGAAGIGWEYRNRDGFLFRARGGVALVALSGDAPTQALPSLGVDAGYAF